MDLSSPTAVAPWPYLPVLIRVALAVGLGLFVGLERERRRKEAGVRTFAFSALLGCLGGMLGDGYAFLSIGLLALLIVFLNWHALQNAGDTEMTTSSALLVTGFAGVLCGKGHTFTPVAVSIATAGLLAWKQPLSGFSTGLTEQELRSAILLGILSFVIYPVLPARPLDPWGLVEPRAAWMTVILVAAIGFVNYLLLKKYGSRGVAATGFLAGLVNSTVVVTELAARVRETGESLVMPAFGGAMLANAAMVLRNAVLLGLLAPHALLPAAPALGAMLVGSTLLAWRPALGPGSAEGKPAPIRMRSPFSLSSALKLGLLFLVLSVADTLAQRYLGVFGFLVVSLIGGVVSSASAVASAAALAANGRLSPELAADGAVLASLASAVTNLPIVLRMAGHPALTTRLAAGTAVVVLLGIAGMLVR